ncbi:MAG: glycoside hydrolase domain-containing protein, partial [Armatimonadota bacterium]
ELMDRVAPGLRRLMTAPRDARLYGKSQIWVPGGLPEASAKEPANKALLEGWTPFNPERWWYICCGPVHPYPNFFADYPTVDMRTVFWLTWKYHKTGFLYWGVEYFGDPKEMTADGPTEKYALGPANMGNGDGTLCYWAPNETFYPSIRLNAIRDGIEDYECFALASKLAEQAEQAGKVPDVVARTRRVLAVSQRVVKDTDASPNFEYSLDPANLLAARRELDDCILTLRKALER